MSDSCTSPLTDFTDPTIPHDRVIVVDGQKFYVFSGFLSFFSEYFLKMFTSNSKEKDQQEIIIDDLSAADFHVFLQAMVPSNGNGYITDTNYKTILNCAGRFMAPEILTMGEAYATETLNKDNFIEQLKLAFQFDLKELKAEIRHYVTKYKEEKSVFCQRDDCKTFRAKLYDDDIDYCSNCYERLERKELGLLDKSRAVVKYQEELKTLPAEAQLFVFHALLERAKQ